jgi:hypothetical protein
MLTDTNTFVVHLNVYVLYKYLAYLIYLCNIRFLICCAYIIYLSNSRLFTGVKMGVLILFIVYIYSELQRSTKVDIDLVIIFLFPVCAPVKSSFEDRMSMRYWWNYNWLGKLKYPEKNLSQC